MKTSFTRILISTLLGFSFGVATAQADGTHYGKIELELDRVNIAAKIKLASIAGDFHLDWPSGKCEIQVGSVFYYCKLDHSQDLLNSQGVLIMQQLPVLHFDNAAIDPLMLMIGSLVPNSARSFTMSTLVSNSDSGHPLGFDLPMYSCLQCEITDQPTNPVALINVFQGAVTRTLEITDASLRNSKLVFSVTLKQMHVNAGDFQIIRDNSSGNFGH
jgi:hypothetical protein